MCRLVWRWRRSGVVLVILNLDRRRRRRSFGRKKRETWRSKLILCLLSSWWMRLTWPLAYLRARVVNRAIYSRDAHFAVSGDEEGGRRKEMRDSGAIDARVEFANSLFVCLHFYISAASLCFSFWFIRPKWPRRMNYFQRVTPLSCRVWWERVWALSSSIKFPSMHSRRPTHLHDEFRVERLDLKKKKKHTRASILAACLFGDWIMDLYIHTQVCRDETG